VLRAVVSPGRIGAQPFGPGIHAVELLRALARVAPDDVEITYQWWGRRGAVDAEALFPDPPRPHVRRTPLPTRAYRELHRAPGFVRRALVGPFDVFHHTGIDLDPPASDDRLVVSLHDLIGRRWPESAEPEWPGTAHLLQRARVVVTVSEFSRGEILDEFGLPDEHVVAIPNGCDLALFHPGRPVPASLDALADRPYVLMVGGATARKNVVRGLEAFRAASASVDDLALVLTGAVASAAPDLVRELVAAQEATVLGYRTRDELADLLAHARLLLFPSLYEGFGLPVIEAFAAGCPVVGSDAGAVVEVSGGHARLVDGTDVDALAGAIVEVAGWSAEVRDAWARDARRRAEAFTWEACGRAHLEVYERVAASRG
jgi:glycosyltransferase involved in cell wall biosynthesis